MNRTIKFRCWHKLRKQMCVVKEISWKTWDMDDYTSTKGELPYNHIVGVGLKDWDEHEFFDDGMDCVLMQFTGLKDKNGKEIYEGDVVDGEQEDYYRNFVKVRGVVRFGKTEPSFGIDDGIANDRGEGMLRIIHGDTNKLVIIGNIYENPDLLKQQPK